MAEIYTIKIDTDDIDYMSGIAPESLFPEHYDPTVLESDNGLMVNVTFVGGAARFYFNELDIDCQFEYFDGDEDYEDEFNEIDLKGENFSVGLVEYIANKVTELTGNKTNF